MKKWFRFEYSAIAIIFLAALALLLWPGSYWYEPSTTVGNYKANQEPIVEYDRKIKRPFFGTYRVEVREVTAPPDEHVCTGSGLGIYDVKESGVQNMPLSYYTNDKNCKRLTPGKYVIHTCWKWHVYALPKQVCIKSNEFTIE